MLRCCEFEAITTQLYLSKLELELGQPTDARPGAPLPYLRTAKAFPSQSRAPASGAARRPCHQGLADKSKSRARAAAYHSRKVILRPGS